MTTQNSNLKQQTVRALFSASAGIGIGFLLKFISIAILAKLLTPDLFGLFGLALAVTLIIKDIGDLGLGVAIIQKDEVTEEDLSTVFWSNLVLGCVLGLVLWFTADIFALMLDDLRLSQVLQVLAILLPLNSVAVVSNALLQRRLNFTIVGIRDIGGEIAFGAVGITMALYETGIWALIGAVCVQWLVRSMIVIVAVPYKPRLVYSWKTLRYLRNFSFAVVGVTILDRVMANLDYFVIGRYLGAAALGYYTLAFQLAVLPAQRITGIVRRVMFPSFARIQNDLHRLRRGLLPLIEVLTVILLPAEFLLFSVAVWLVPNLYSPEWAPAIVAVQILAIAGTFYGLDIVDTVFYAIGQPHLRLGFLAARAAIFLLLVFTNGLEMGVLGVALSLTISVAITTIGGITVTAFKAQVPLTEMLKPFRGALLGCTVGLCSLAIMRLTPLHPQISGVNSSFFASGIFLLCYVGILLLYYRSFFVSLRQNIGLLLYR